MIFVFIADFCAALLALFLVLFAMADAWERSDNEPDS